MTHSQDKIMPQDLTRIDVPRTRYAPRTHWTPSGLIVITLAMTVLYGTSSPLCNVARGAAIVYSTRADFEAAEPDVSVTGFEESFETSASLDFDGFSVTENSAGSFLSSRTDYVSEGERSLGFTWNGDGYLEFSFDRPTYSFAADILDFGTCCGALGLQVIDETGQIEATAAVGDELPRGNIQFFGVATDEPFRTLRFSSDTVSDNDLITFDRMLFRSVPEPAMGGAALLGLLVACARLRRPTRIDGRDR